LSATNRVVVIGVASNFRRAKNIKKSLRKMRLLLGQLEISQLTKSADFSGKGAFYWNVVVKFKSRLPIKEIKTLMESIESSCGRRKQSKELGCVSMDLDLLLREDASSEKFCLLDRGLPDNLPLVGALTELFSFQELLSVDPLLERSLKNLDRERFSSIKIKWDSIL